jgi:hypothetical protein
LPSRAVCIFAPQTAKRGCSLISGATRRRKIPKSLKLNPKNLKWPQNILREPVADLVKMEIFATAGNYGWKEIL